MGLGRGIDVAMEGEGRGAWWEAKLCGTLPVSIAGVGEGRENSWVVMAVGLGSATLRAGGGCLKNLRLSSRCRIEGTRVCM